MTAAVKPLIEIKQQVMRLLYRKLGVVDTLRFLRQFMPGFGDYTEDREALFASKPLPEMVEEMEKQREQR